MEKMQTEENLLRETWLVLDKGQPQEAQKSLLNNLGGLEPRYIAWISNGVSKSRRLWIVTPTARKIGFILSTHRQIILLFISYILIINILNIMYNQ